jgi:hypothetical protein
LLELFHKKEAVIGFCTVGNIGFIMGLGNFVISIVLFIIWAKQ